MNRSELGFLSRFVPGLRRPDRPSVAAKESWQEAARLVVDQFAREAVLALRQFEDTFPASGPEAERQIGQRFGQLWDEAGLGRLD